MKGRYAKGIAKRAEILDTALRVIDENGFTGATVKELADAVDITQNGLLYYFGSKDALFLEILQRNDVAVEAMVDPEHTDFSVALRERVVAALVSTLDAPGMSQLFLSVATAAVEDAHVAHEFIRERYAMVREIAASALTELQRRGEFPAESDPVACAALIAASIDGLQLQWLYDRTLDVRAYMAQLLTSLGLPAPAPNLEPVTSL